MVCKGSQCEHWLNGKKILEAGSGHGHPVKDQESRIQIDDEWLNAKKRGFRLALSTTGFTAWYRSFKVRAIPKDEEVSTWGQSNGIGPIGSGLGEVKGEAITAEEIRRWKGERKESKSENGQTNK